MCTVAVGGELPVFIPGAGVCKLTGAIPLFDCYAVNSHGQRLCPCFRLSEPQCGGKTTAQGACGGNGICQDEELCRCDPGYSGKNCELNDVAKFPLMAQMERFKGKHGESCDMVCTAQKMECKNDYLPIVNGCGEIHRGLGPCNPLHGCRQSYGPDQPLILQDGACLTNVQPHLFSCQTFHPHGSRLCPCFKGVPNRL
jgi:hypothetical protein